jgi:hypothetical protein
MKIGTYLSLVALLIAALLVTETSFAQRRRGTNVQTNTRGEPVTDCSQIEVTFGDDAAYTAQEELTVPRGQVQFLGVRAATNGGISVQGWNRDEYSVKTCKAAPRPDLLTQIATSNAAGRVTVSGPSMDEWVAYLIVRAPANGALDLETVNGPMSVRDLVGWLRARTTNGPVTLNGVNGNVEVTAANGPITLTGGSGNQKVNASNGPVSVVLNGSRWDGEGLEVTTANGPLKLTIPDSYASAVRVDTSDRSPVTCRARQCSQAQRDWSNPTRIEFGGPNAVVKLSTINGPVTINGGQ